MRLRAVCGRLVSVFIPSGYSRGDGSYWIDPNGGSPLDSFPAYCDMSTESGGWTLVATKVSPSMTSLITSSYSQVAAATLDKDAGSCIHPGMKANWEEVMFRFSDVHDIRVIYNWKEGSRPGVTNYFDSFLIGGPTRSSRYGSYGRSHSTTTDLHGFYKYSPADGGERNPPTGFASVSSIRYSSYGISEDPTGSDKWLNLWSAVDVSNNYSATDDSKAIGTKCIAGYCYLDKPVWIMVR